MKVLANFFHSFFGVKMAEKYQIEDQLDIFNET